MRSASPRRAHTSCRGSSAADSPQEDWHQPCATTKSWSSSTPTSRSAPSPRRSTRSSPSSRTTAARVEKVDIWGRRRLAYEINKHAEGIYAVIDLQAKPAAVAGARPPAQPQRVGAADQGPAPGRAVTPWPAKPSSPSSATSPPTPSCASPRRVRPSRRSPSPPRRGTFDRNTNEWKDGEALFLRCSIWRQAAENVAESLHRGMRVVVSGPAQAALLRDPRGREAHGHRARRRRGRPVAEVRDGQGQPHPARLVLRRRLRRLRRRRRRRRRRAGRRPVGLGPRPPAAAASPTSPPSNALSSDLADLLDLKYGDNTWPSHRFASPRRSRTRSVAAKIDYIDYKDTNLLRKFISDRGKIRARRVTGVTSQQQRQIAKAIKNAREMALLPYTSTAR